MAFNLPDKPIEAGAPLSSLNLFLYGPPKVGKSSFCAEAPNSFFLDLENGLKHITARKQTITTWEEFCGYAKALRETRHDIKTVIIDTLDALYRMCHEYVCTIKKIKHASDLDHGKAWGYINSELLREVHHLTNDPRFGCWIVCHSTEKELESPVRGKYIKTVPSVSGTVAENATAWVDMVLFCDLVETRDERGRPSGVKHIIRTKPSLKYEAGDKSGRLPEILDLNYNAFKEAYEAPINTKEAA